MNRVALSATAALALVAALVPVAAQRGRGAARGPAGPLPTLWDGRPDLTGIWTGIGFTGRAPEILPWAEKVIAGYAVTQGAADFEARCLPGGPPRMAPYHTALFATPKEVVILFEGNTHMYRQLFVDGSEHPKNLKPTFYGDSRAHWEGDWLVVDTIGFLDKSWFDFAGTPHTKDMHLVEKFHRIDYGNLEEEATIEDPGVFPKAWTQRKNIALDPAFDMTEYVCNENNQDPAHLDALLKGSAAPAKKTLAESGGVRPPQPRRPPAPPPGATPRTHDGKVSFEGVWVPTTTKLPSDPSYQPWATALYEQRKANKQKDDPERYCLPNGAVRVNALPYKILQRPDTVLMMWEGNTHSYRRFFLDGRKPNLDIEPESWTGQATGKWDGDALVVDTVGFNDKTWLDSTGKPHSDQMHLTERYRRPDLGHMNVDVTIDDAKALTKPYSFTRTFTLAPGWELQEYVCQALLDGVYDQ
jgi:hypothetical protein